MNTRKNTKIGSNQKSFPLFSFSFITPSQDIFYTTIIAHQKLPVFKHLHRVVKVQIAYQCTLLNMQSAKIKTRF